MPATSTRQRDFMGMMLARKRKGLPIAVDMSAQQLEDFARGPQPKRYSQGGKVGVEPIPVPAAAKKGVVWPRLGAVDQMIREPAKIVGESGRVYGTVAENGAKDPEIITITNPGRKLRLPVDKETKGAKPYAAGGSVGVDPNASAGYQEELAAAKQVLADQKAAIEGAKNTGDLATAGMAQTLQNTSDQQYAQLGVAKPADVAVVPGARPLGGSPLVRGAIQTQEQVATAAGNRDVSLAAAQSRANSAQRAVDNLSNGDQGSSGGGSATGPRMAASQGGPAQQGPQDWRGGAQQANWRGPNRPALPLPIGMVRDPETGKVVTAGQERITTAERGTVYDEVNRRYTSHADLNARTDQHGNVRRDDGVWVSPEKNELLDGHWTDPSTGNRLIDARTWESPAGLQFHIQNPKSGAGYWSTRDGFVQQGDGEWFNPKTNQYMKDGVIYKHDAAHGYGQPTSAGYTLEGGPPAGDEEPPVTAYALP